MLILPGEPRQVRVFYPRDWASFEQQLGGFCCENLANLAGFELGTWQSAKYPRQTSSNINMHAEGKLILYVV